MSRKLIEIVTNREIGEEEITAGAFYTAVAAANALVPILSRTSTSLLGELCLAEAVVCGALVVRSAVGALEGIDQVRVNGRILFRRQDKNILSNN